MRLNITTKLSRILFFSLAGFGLLFTATLAAFAPDWGTAYGQTVGPDDGGPNIQITVVYITPTEIEITITARYPASPSLSNNQGTFASNAKSAAPVLTNLLLVCKIGDEFKIKSANATKGTPTFTDYEVRDVLDTFAPGETVVVKARADLVRPVPATGTSVSATLTTANGTPVAGSKEGRTVISPPSANPGNGNSNGGGTVVIPGLPNTGSEAGTASQKFPLELWQLGLVALLLGATLTISMVALRKASRK